MTEYNRPYKWKAGQPTTKLSAEELTAQGYVKTSNAYGLVARIDRPDWIEFLARHYHRAPADFCIVTDEGLVPAPNWGAHYLQFSKDKHTVPYDVMRKIPSAAGGAKYVPLAHDVPPPLDPYKKVSFAEKAWANIRYFFNSEVR